MRILYREKRNILSFIYLLKKKSKIIIKKSEKEVGGI